MDQEMNQHNPPDEFEEALHEIFEAEAAAPSTPAPPAKARFELGDVSHTHEAIMNWMIAHPERPLRDCAAAFGYSQSWLSTLIHSNLFQARLREKQDQVFSGIKEDLTTKLGALADIGVEKLQAKMETSEDPKFILETTKVALATLGFGAKAGAGPVVNAQNVQQNFYVASQADLVAARERMRSSSGAVSSPDSQPLLGDATPSPAGGTPERP